MTPLLIVPILLILARHWLTPEQIHLSVISFASLGHHLPGFMRAYGDRELFRRFYWRFLLTPLLVFALALLFTPPAALASALHLPWKHLHGLELILLFWGTWHGLMQTYGFMRIYDVKMGVNDRRAARLDHWLCLTMFAAGVVFSDARVFGIANAIWQSGLPLFGPEWLRTVRIAVGAAGIATMLAYLWQIVSRWRRNEPICWIKLLLAASTGWFYWYSGRLSTNLLIGIAMFEIFHAVQYYAIVWIYNRRLMQKAGDRFGLLGFLFRDRWSMLGIYLALIAAYSSIQFFSVDVNEYVFSTRNTDAHQWLMALFVTSSMLHFYFDGFIWQVSERKTQENLVENVPESLPRTHFVPAAMHIGKWAMLLLIAGGLLVSEWRQRNEWNTLRSARVLALGALTPKLPECQILLSREALSRHDTRGAVAHAEKAIALRPRSHSIQADLGLALMQSGRFEEAKEHLQQAIAITSKPHWRYHSDLGLILAYQGKFEEAERELLFAIDAAPMLETPRQHLAEFYLRMGRTDAAASQFDVIAEQFPQSLNAELGKGLLLSKQGKHDEAVRLGNFLVAGHPSDWRAQLALGSALNASGNGHLAIEPLEKARRLRPYAAEIYYHLGLAHFQRGRPTLAIQPLQNAVQIDPLHFLAHLQLGNTFYVLNQPLDALKAYGQCRKLRPTHPDLCANLGGLLATLGKTKEAEAIYREGVAANAGSAALHYNLGLLLLQQGNREEARDLIERAEQLGMTMSPEVRAALRL